MTSWAGFTRDRQRFTIVDGGGSTIVRAQLTPAIRLIFTPPVDGLPPVATPRLWVSSNGRKWASGNDREWI